MEKFVSKGQLGKWYSLSVAKKSLIDRGKETWLNKEYQVKALNEEAFFQMKIFKTIAKERGIYGV